jgi:hypothetical protein
MNIILNAPTDDQSSNTRMTGLQDTAYRVRQQAISAGGDLEGWRLARAMRDVTSYADADAIELKLAIWLKARTLDCSVAAT